jgi:hypothetical protein
MSLPYGIGLRPLAKPANLLYYMPDMVSVMPALFGTHVCHVLYIYSPALGSGNRRACANMAFSPSLSSLHQGFFTTAVGFLLYALIRVIYNIYFHPLSHFPGPRGAACTRWWLAYMELGRGISLSTLRKELHQKYGTVSP